MTRVAVYNIKGGTGKTTVTLGLAGAAAGMGLDVLVADADPGGAAGEYLYAGVQPTDDHVRAGKNSWRGVHVLRTTGVLPPFDGLTLIDCPPSQREAAASLLQAELVIVPVIPEPFALRGLQKVLESLPTSMPIAVVLNQWRQTRAVEQSIVELREALGDELWEPFIPRREKVQAVQRRRRPLQVAGARGMEGVVEAFDALATRMLKVTS